MSLPQKHHQRFESPLIDSRDMIVEFKDTFPAVIQTEFAAKLKCPVLVVNSAERGATSVGLLKKLAETLRDYQPDFLILNIGTSDSRFRRTGLRTHGGRLWQKVSYSSFEVNLANIVPTLALNKAVLITLGIVPASSEITRKYPASDQQFTLYNARLEQFTKSVDGHFLSFSDIRANVDEYVAPDGLHYGRRMHEHIASCISKLALQSDRVHRMDYQDCSNSSSS